MTYSTEFELGDGTEKFVWIRFDGGTPRLEGLQHRITGDDDDEVVTQH